MNTKMEIINKHMQYCVDITLNKISILRHKNAILRVISRPWISFLLGVSLTLMLVTYYWPINDTLTLERQNEMLKVQLKMSHNHMEKVLGIKSDKNEPRFFYNTVVNEEIEVCETIHVALVCGGYNATRVIVPLIKSILFYRRNPIHFHLMIDDKAFNILEILFNTWDLPEVEISFYHINDAIPSVYWIPNAHYSGIYGLLKLTLPEILPTTISNVIVLDTDLTFLSDIAELWVLFKRMVQGEVLGLVENQSDWYLGKLWHEFTPWPAVGRGFNTGMMLLHLENIRNKLNWQQLWKNVTEENLLKHSGTKLADQDILNALIKRHPNLVYKLDCEWNVQLSDNSRSESCYMRSYSIIKIIHWNSPRKYKVKLKNIKYFLSIHQMFLDYDGNLLRNKLISCKDNSTTFKTNDTDICHDFRSAFTAKLRTHLYYMEFSYSHRDSYDVTLVAQLSMDRLQFLEELSAHWEGPMSLAFYVTDSEAQKLLTFVEDWSETLKKRKNIAYHLVYKQGTHYPVNHLRNVALRNVVTPYVFLMDIDFLPMYGIYEYLRKSIQLLSPGPLKNALVVPAFETQRYRTSFPKNKHNVLKQLQNGNLYTFRYHVWKKGHAPTDYHKWINTSSPYLIKWQSDYEPYIVAHKSIPNYDPRFTGFGWNKVSHVMEMHAQGYNFVVLPAAFIIHMPHAPSLEINQFRNSMQYRMCLKNLKEEFITDLNRKYNTGFQPENV